jgi:hypothetical protein
MVFRGIWYITSIIINGLLYSMIKPANILNLEHATTQQVKVFKNVSSILFSE